MSQKLKVALLVTLFLSMIFAMTLITESACTSLNGCGSRAFLADLQSEYDQLSCVGNKLNKTIELMVGMNNTSLTNQIKVRTKQLKKVTEAQSSISVELNILASKCSKYDGDNCDIPSCFGVLPSNSSICSGHGKCVSLDNCQCDQGWSSPNCSIVTCKNIPANDPSVCSGRGTCISYNTCSCMDGSSGVWCDSKTITIDANGVRKYSDNTYAKSCKDYISPTQPGYFYTGNTGNGYYWIKPDSTPLKVHCEMVANGGGLTGFTSEVEASSLNSGSQLRNYIYLKDSNTWYKSPTMTTIWTSAPQRVGGTYYYTTNNGIQLSSLNCGNQEVSLGIGIGCSDGPYNTPKCWVEYRMGEHLVRVCQDTPGIFGSGCQNNMALYII